MDRKERPFLSWYACKASRIVEEFWPTCFFYHSRVESRKGRPRGFSWEGLQAKEGQGHENDFSVLFSSSCCRFLSPPFLGMDDWLTFFMCMLPMV